MTSLIYQREAARRDLVDHFVYLAENADLPTAKRFLSNAEVTFSELVQQPLVGSPLKLHHPALSGLRKWRVNGFDNHLIFYEARPGAVSIVRVLHAASDWWGLLGIES